MDDRKIITQILNGDKERYRLLVEKYQDRLVNFVFAIVQDYDEANDIAQIAFIKAYSSLKKYNPKYQFSTWIYRIAINQAKSNFRRKKTVSIDVINERASEEDIMQSMQEKDESLLIRNSIAGLDKNYQLVINMYYWQGLNYQQIADIMDMPLGTIKTWLRRAKQKLKEELNGQI